MKKSSDTLTELRRKAEEKVSRLSDKFDQDDHERAYHELKVHQIELEMQNQQLHETQAELENTVKSYSDLYHHTPIGFITIDQNGFILGANETFARMCSIPLHELHHSHASNLLVPDSEAIFRQRLPAFFKKPEGKTLNLQLRKTGQQTCYIELQGRHLPIKTPEQKPLLACSVLDVTLRQKALKEKREVEQQLRQKYKMEAIGVLSEGIAHNFNNSLMIILGNIELAQLKNTTPEVDAFLNNAKLGLNSSRDLVQQILTYGRKAPANQGPTTLMTVIDETLKLLRSTLPTTLEIDWSVSSSLKTISVMANVNQLQEVIINLCINAHHATRGLGKIRVTLEKADLAARDIPSQFNCRPGRYARITIEDNGSGIPAHVLDKIFDPFFTTKDVGEGTGMGLATVSGIMEQHAGMITVDSQVGKGTAFHLYFPLIAVRRMEQDNHETYQKLEAGRERILVVDDEELLTDIWSQVLTEFGYTVTCMNDSEEALRHFSADPHQFDLVISDQTMPQLTGEELSAKLVKINPNIKIILCTGNYKRVNREHFDKIGINDLLVKPVDISVLLKHVRKTLDRESAALKSAHSKS
ncbi:MAG: response regulator [Desulfuromonadales bacterium]|nr:response regulator [Desulfuromonadales bacterium]MBN2792502.1 response regulator [Desulfuromonadales bacterium]